MAPPLPRLKAIHLYLTQKCSISYKRCKPCWLDVKVGSEAESKITVGKLKDTIYEAKGLGLQRLKILGGEPYIRKELVHALVKIGSVVGLSPIYIETNGMLIDEHEAKFLKDHSVGVCISLDFPDERHEQPLGLKGSFERVIMAMKLLSKHNVPWECIMTVTKSNFEDIYALARLVFSLGASGLEVHPCFAPASTQRLKNVLLTPIECLKLARVIAQLDKIYKGKVIITTMPLALITPFLKWPRPLRVAGLCYYKNLLSILPNGDVTLCSIGMTHPETIFGNICQNSISRIWKGPCSYLKELRNLTPDNLRGICSRCVFNNHCANSCPAYVYETFGTFSASHPICQALYEMGLFPNEYVKDEHDSEMAEDELMGVWEATRYLDFPVDVVYDMLEQGELPGEKVEGRWRINSEDLDHWLDEEISQEELKKLSKRLEIDQKREELGD